MKNNILIISATFLVISTLGVVSGLADKSILLVIINLVAWILWFPQVIIEYVHNLKEMVFRYQVDFMKQNDDTKVLTRAGIIVITKSQLDNGMIKYKIGEECRVNMDDYYINITKLELL